MDLRSCRTLFVLLFVGTASFPTTVTGIYWGHRQIKCEEVLKCSPGFHCMPQYYTPPPTCWIPFCYYPETNKIPACVKNKDCDQVTTKVSCATLLECASGHHCEPEDVTISFCNDNKQDCVCSSRVNATEKMRCVPDMCSMSPPGAPIPCSSMINCNHGYHCEPAMITPRPTCLKKPGCRCPPPGPDGPKPECVQDPLCATVPREPVPCESLIDCPEGNKCEPEMVERSPACVEEPGCRCPTLDQDEPAPRCILPWCPLSPPGHPPGDSSSHWPTRSCMRSPNCRCPPRGPRGPRR